MLLRPIGSPLYQDHQTDIKDSKHYSSSFTSSISDRPDRGANISSAKRTGPKPATMTQNDTFSSLKVQPNGIRLADDSDCDENAMHKTILVGDSGVGKTSLLVQFDQGGFGSGSFSATVGIGFTNKVVNVDGTKVKLQIWDTAGQERFRSVTHAYYRDAHALLLLYDVTNKASFDNIRAWLAEINEYAQDDVVIMLLGNKCDMSTERVIRTEDGQRLAKEYDVAFMETSAKTGMNVELAFMAVARDLKSRKTRNPDEPRFNVADYVDQEKQRAGCCS